MNGFGGRCKEKLRRIAISSLELLATSSMGSISGAFHRTLALLDGRIAYSRPKIVTHAGRRNRKKKQRMVEVNLAVLREGEIELARRRGTYIPLDQVSVADAMDRILKDPEKLEKLSAKNKDIS